MPTNMDLDQGLAAANATYEALFSEFEARQLFPGVYNRYTKIVPNTGTWENHFVWGIPEMRVWAGSRIEKVLRHYKDSLTPQSHESTVAIKRLTITRDNTGAVGSLLRGLFRGGEDAYDNSVSDSLASNSGTGPACFNGQNLFSASHPHVGGGSGVSNLAAATNLSHANYGAARAAQRLYTFETGRPMKISANVMEVGPNLEQRAKEILEATQRVVATDQSASEATSAVVDTTTMDNVWRGELDLIVNDRMTNYHWRIYDTRDPDNQPMLLIDERKPEAHNQVDMTSERRYQLDEFLYGLEGEWKVGAGNPFTAYAGTGTA